MNILILGSKGFIGSHCYKYFSAKHNTYGCDVVNDEADSNYFLIDANAADYTSVFSKQPFDVCINCSGAASVPDSITNTWRDFELNTVNVFKMLDAISRYQPGCRFLNLSSAAVYGNPDSLPVHESATVHPLSPYGWHKRYAETICKEFFITKKIATFSVRIFSAYGEGLKKQLFWDLYQKTKKAKQVQLFGTGNESRDFIYIHDLVKALELVMNKAAFDGGCINVANGKEITLREAATTFINELGNGFSINFSNENRSGDPLNWCAGISALQAMGYQQAYSLQQGLKNYIEWLKKEKL